MHGRAGRDKLQGKVIIQTYNPDEFSIQCSKEQNYDKFYETEIALREQLKYPPFCDIIVISFNSLMEDEIIKISNGIYTYLKPRLYSYCNVFRPMPSPIDKIQNRYRWRMIIKGQMNDEVNKILNDCLKKFYKKNIKTTKMSIDINPNNMV